jgi:CheY-like chemotaxis protein
MKKTIWIAEDDPDDRMLIKEAFEEYQYSDNISFFEDGEKVLFKLNDGYPSNLWPLPSLLILDLNMPKINGIELLQIIKKSNRTRNIPVVILTTSRINGDKEKLMNLGADDFITKPFSFDSMLKITRDLIEKYG